LITYEETIHGNDVQILSIDKAGFRGDLLRNWQNPNALGLEEIAQKLVVCVVDSDLG